MGLSTSAEWIGTVPSPLRTIVQQGKPLVRSFVWSLLRGTPVVVGPGGVLPRLLEGLLFGVGRGLAVSGSGQLFVAADVLGWRAAWGAVEVGGLPALWLGSAIGLGVLLRQHWADLGRELQAHRDWRSLLPLVAALPCLVLQLGLHPTTDGLLGGVAVGTSLLLTGRAHRSFAPDQKTDQAGKTVSLTTALVAGLLASLGAFMGLSAVSVLIAVAVSARVDPERAGRFALMTITPVALIEGIAGWGATASLGAVPLIIGAALGAAAGGWLLLRVLLVRWRSMLPWLGSYVTALGAVLLLFGVFAP